MLTRLLIAALAATLLGGAGAAHAAHRLLAGLAPAPALPGTAVGAARGAVPPAATVFAPHAAAKSPTPAPARPTAKPLRTATLVAKAPVSDPVRLVIPAIDLDRSLLSVGLTKQLVPIVPKHDIGWYNLSAKPGQGENVVLWGHVLRFKAAPKLPAPFARLKELEVGDRLTLYAADGKAHPYVVIEKVWATPDQVEYILPQGRELVTMVSCIGDKVIAAGGVEMSHRLITIAAPVRSAGRP